jgi:hypothetical protein
MMSSAPSSPWRSTRRVSKLKTAPPGASYGQSRPINSTISHTSGLPRPVKLSGLSFADSLFRMDMASQSSSEVMLESDPSFHEMLDRFEDASRRQAAQLESWSEEAWARTGQLRSRDRVVLERPAGDIVWLFHFDEIHHRGQLSTYLRPIGAKVPSIYGASGGSVP